MSRGIVFGGEKRWLMRIGYVAALSMLEGSNILENLDWSLEGYPTACRT
jgi:hypothetical protein